MMELKKQNRKCLGGRFGARASQGWVGYTVLSVQLTGGKAAPAHIPAQREADTPDTARGEHRGRLRT